MNLHEFTWPDITRIHVNWHYTNLCDLTLHEFTWPDITRIHMIWHYTNLCDLTLHKFMWPDITRIYVTWLYMNLWDLTLCEFTLKKLYRGSYIAASCQVWLHFAKQFQRRFFETVANQKQELPLAAIFVGGAERNGETLYRTLHVL